MVFRKFAGAVLLPFLILTPSIMSLAQTKPVPPSVSGVVVDAAESAPIPDAHIWVHGQSGNAYLEARPDKSGRFSIQLPDGYYFVLVGAPGFAPVCTSIWVRPGKPVVISPRLLPDYENLQDAR